MRDENAHIRRALENDAAHLIRIIAEIAPAAGLDPANIARLDQLAAATRYHRPR